MAAQNTGKITQVIGAVLDMKFAQGVLPEINEAVEIAKKYGGDHSASFVNGILGKIARMET